jgi:hypothetical protein
MVRENSAENTNKICSNPLNRHLIENNQTYCCHLRDAWYYSLQCGLATITFFIHGIIPFMFEHTGSHTINNLQNIISQKQTKF